MSKVVLFKEGSIPRIFKNPSEEEIQAMRELGKVLVDPKIPKGVPPHKWELDGNRIQIGASKSELPSVVISIKEVPVEVAPDFDDLHEIEDNMEFLRIELLDKVNKMCIIGLVMALFLLLLSLRPEIQYLIRNINV